MKLYTCIRHYPLLLNISATKQWEILAVFPRIKEAKLLFYVVDLRFLLITLVLCPEHNNIFNEIDLNKQSNRLLLAALYSF